VPVGHQLTDEKPANLAEQRALKACSGDHLRYRSLPVPQSQVLVNSPGAGWKMGAPARVGSTPAAPNEGVAATTGAPPRRNP
jgi:hypothetical protein